MTLLFALPAAVSANSPVVQWTEPEENVVTVTQGHLILRWEVSEAFSAAENLRFQLQQSFGETFDQGHIVYEGPDFGTFISGLPPNGARLRVRAAIGEDAWGPWSETLEVSVDYPHNNQVLSLGLLGGAMFLILLVTIFRGATSSPSAVQG